jgi:hypothetical protein
MSHYPAARSIDVTTALALLQDALDRCRDEDMRTPEVFAALDFLEARASVKWPFDQFRRVQRCGLPGMENRRPLAAF